MAFIEIGSNKNYLPKMFEYNKKAKNNNTVILLFI